MCRSYRGPPWLTKDERYWDGHPSRESTEEKMYKMVVGNLDSGQDSNPGSLLPCALECSSPVNLTPNSVGGDAPILLLVWKGGKKRHGRNAPTIIWKGSWIINCAAVWTDQSVCELHGLEKLRLEMSIIQIKRLCENIFVIGVYIFPKIDERITSFYYLQDLLRSVHAGLKQPSQG